MIYLFIISILLVFLSILRILVKYETILHNKGERFKNKEN